MAEVVVLGAGLGGTLMAFELAAQLRKADRLTLISQGSRFHFVPSNPWVAVGWRERPEIEVDLAAVMRRKRITLRPEGARRVHPAESRVELEDGSSIAYDYLVIATGPDLAFDEIEGLGPGRATPSRSAMSTMPSRRSAHSRLLPRARPGRDRRGAGRVLLRPGLRVRLYPRHRTAQAPDARPRADDLRHRRALYRPSRARWRRRHQGAHGERVPQPPHQVDHQRAAEARRGRHDDGGGGRRGRHACARRTTCRSRSP